MTPPKPLKDKITLVAGATRGAGRGIARMLGEAGATVICTGRSTRGSASPIGRPETIEETAKLVTEAGGQGVAIRADHNNIDEVKALFKQVKADFGRLDVLVNDIGGEGLSDWKPAWETDLDKGLELLDTAVRTHIITARLGIPLMLEQKSGLIVEITDGDHAGYRGALFYDLAKNQSIRFAFALAAELKPKGIASIAVTPGFLRSEAMLEMLGVTEANWEDAAAKERGFSESETPCYVGRAVAALAADPNVMDKTGGVYASWELAKEYGFTDIDGRKPDWWTYVRTSINEILDRGGPQDDGEKYWVDAWHSQLKADPRFADLCRRIEEATQK